MAKATPTAVSRFKVSSCSEKQKSIADLLLTEKAMPSYGDLQIQIWKGAL
jgi:hypothetical protein